MSLSCRVTIASARVLLVVVGISGFGCAANGIDGTAIPSGNAGADQSNVTASEPNPAERGRKLAEVNCVPCHGPGFLPTFQKSRSEWLETTDRMLSQYGGMMDGGAS
ncbi:MAG: hypothetical protein OEM64_13015, partial [Gammaproteobacteria bacterium]|nr:hypothetical protein [Gammaproteobacteria bacterium]